MTTYRITYTYTGSREIDADSYEDARDAADKVEQSIWAGRNGDVELSLTDTDIEPESS